MFSRCKNELITKRIILKIIIHENWDAVAINNDVAVIKLSRKVDLNGAESQVGTVCLPDSENIDALADKNCVATGFGRLSWSESSF